MVQNSNAHCQVPAENDLLKTGLVQNLDPHSVSSSLLPLSLEVGQLRNNPKNCFVG
jgi:hypothetical protein